MRKGELNISEKTYATFIKLAGYQIIGGFMGLGLITWAVCKTGELDIATILLIFLMGLLFLYSLFCGIKCIQAKKHALKYSMVNQCLQIIGFAVFGFAFSYVAGLYLSLDLDFTNGFNFSFGFGISNFFIRLNGETETLTVNINLVAIGIIIWIVTLMKKVKLEIDFEKTEEIGIDITHQSIEN